MKKRDIVTVLTSPKLPQEKSSFITITRETLLDKKTGFGSRGGFTKNKPQ